MQDFYRRFEDAYRGSEQLITQRLTFYTPFIQSLLLDTPNPVALDLGCGRGEWLKFIQTLGIENILGIDLNEQMLEAAKAQSLNVIKDNALTFLADVPDNEYDLITAFHFVEHIDFSSLQELVANLFRVLKPNGIIILETPNAENLVVGSNNFYLDPTHIKPLPSLLLEFLVKYHGFGLTTTARLQHNKEFDKIGDVGLYDVINGASKDYSVIACKRSKPQSGEFANLFTNKYGYSLTDMLVMYDNRRNAEKTEFTEKLSSLANETGRMVKNISLIENKYKTLEGNYKTLEDNYKTLEDNYKTLDENHESMVVSYNNLLNNYKNEQKKLSSELQGVYNSASWKLTHFLRVINAKRKTRKAGLRKLKRLTERIIFSKTTSNIYHKLYAISPNATLKIRNFLMRFFTYVSVKSVTLPLQADSSSAIDGINNLGFMELSVFINQHAHINSDKFSEYLDILLDSDALIPLFSTYPKELKMWVSKFLKIAHIGNNDILINSLPHNNIDHTIGYALYISLLGRLPGSIKEVDYPVKHLCTVILNSNEYKEFSGRNLTGWFKS